MDRNDPIAGLAPVHPGHFLRDVVLPGVKEGKAELARLLGVSRPALYNLLDGRSDISTEMALKLGKLLGNGGEFWASLQAQYDLRLARERMADQLEAIPTIKAA